MSIKLNAQVQELEKRVIALERAIAELLKKLDEVEKPKRGKKAE